jgi:hypothetical protein
MRPITNDDLWSAIRGLGMYRMERAELTALVEHHGNVDLFASRVIAEAARQVLAARPSRQ